MYRLAIVDDEPRLLNGLKNYYDWSKIGFEVTASFRNGKEILDYLNVHSVDVILTDISMPVMDGIELAEVLHKRKSSIVLVFLSGYADFQYAKQALKFGVYDYILKPIKTDELYSVFNRIRMKLGESLPDENYENYYTKLVQKAQLHMESNLSDASLKETAAHIGLSASYLSSIYKKQTNSSYSEDLLKMKMTSAKHLLDDSYLKVYEIAEKLGYDDPKNFTRAFRTYYGYSPRDYKQKNGETL